MPKYVVLINYTEQGARTAMESVERAMKTENVFDKHGVKRLHQFWTMGSHDLVTVMEAPDDETLMHAMLIVGALGNVRTTSLKAFDAADMARVIAEA